MKAPPPSPSRRVAAPGPRRAEATRARSAPDDGASSQASLEATYDAVETVLDFSQPADARLSAFLREHGKLGPRERERLAETVYGVLRRLRTLQYLAGLDGTAQATPRRLALAWLARFGGHNLREFEGRVPADLLTWLRDAKAAGLDGLPAAVALDLPDWLHQRLSALYGDDLPALMAALNAPAPLDLRVNPLKATREQALAGLAASGIAGTPTPWSPLGIRVRGKPALQRHPLFLDGVLEVQDEGSQLLGLLLAPKRGEMVCDFCAGAGGKTLLLGALMRNSGRLYAFDVSPRRLAKMKPRLARAGLTNVQSALIAHERDTKVKRLAGKFDRVLVDAPCSGLGTLRRNPDLKWRQSMQSVAELVHKQAAILAAAATLVKPGGRLVYATCSLLPEENEAVVEAFLADRPAFRALDTGSLAATRDMPSTGGPWLRLDPVRHGTDGFFAAVMEHAA